MVVLAANILVRAVLGRRVRQLIEAYSPRVRFFAPDVAFEDAAKHLPALLKKRGKSEAELSASLEYLGYIIEPVESDLYAAFEKDARERLRGRDENGPKMPIFSGVGWPSGLQAV